MVAGGEAVVRHCNLLQNLSNVDWSGDQEVTYSPVIDLISGTVM